MSKAVIESLTTALPHAIVSTHDHRGDDTAVVRSTNLVEVCTLLKRDPHLAFDMCIDVTAVDHLGKRDESERFDVVYHFLSTLHGHRVRLKVRVGDMDPRVDTISHLWASANWAEREVWDMYGIRFTGHPDLRRILNFESFTGHPLRKDYPLAGEQSLIEEGPVSTEGICTPVHANSPHLNAIDDNDEKAPTYGDSTRAR